MSRPRALLHVMNISNPWRRMFAKETNWEDTHICYRKEHFGVHYKLELHQPMDHYVTVKLLPPRLRCGIAENHKSFLKNKVQYHVLFCYLMPEMQMRCKVFSAMPHLDVSKYHSTLDAKCELRVFSRELQFFLFSTSSSFIWFVVITTNWYQTSRWGSTFHCG